MQELMIAQAFSIILFIIKDPKQRRKFSNAMIKLRNALIQAFPFPPDELNAGEKS